MNSMHDMPQHLKHMLRGIISQPIPLNWMGWRSDTYALQRAGWQFSAYQMPEYNGLRIAVRQPEQGIYGMSDHKEINCMNSYPGAYMNADIDRIDFNIKLAFEYPVAEAYMSDHMFEPVDMTPGYVDINMNHRKLSDYDIFRRMPPHNDDKILLEEASMSDVLEYALNKQKPKQAEIRKRILQERDRKTYQDASTIKAQLCLV